MKTILNKLFSTDFKFDIGALFGFSQITTLTSKFQYIIYVYNYHN